MTEFEMQILRLLNGEKFNDLQWGAAMSEATEWLSENGYVTAGPNYQITPKGKAAAIRAMGDKDGDPNDFKVYSEDSTGGWDD